MKITLKQLRRIIKEELENGSSFGMKSLLHKDDNETPIEDDEISFSSLAQDGHDVKEPSHFDFKSIANKPEPGDAKKSSSSVSKDKEFSFKSLANEGFPAKKNISRDETINSTLSRINLRLAAANEQGEDYQIWFKGEKAPTNLTVVPLDEAIGYNEEAPISGIYEVPSSQRFADPSTFPGLQVPGQDPLTDEDREKFNYPDDYEQCGYCGFDHSYDYEEASEWHTSNDPTNSLYESKILNNLSEMAHSDYKSEREKIQNELKKASANNDQKTVSKLRARLLDLAKKFNQKTNESINDEPPSSMRLSWSDLKQNHSEAYKAWIQLGHGIDGYTPSIDESDVLLISNAFGLEDAGDENYAYRPLDSNSLSASNIWIDLNEEGAEY